MRVSELRSVAVVGLLAGLAGLAAGQPASAAVPAAGTTAGGVLAPALAATTDLFQLDENHQVIYFDPISEARLRLGGFAADGLAAAGGSGAPEFVLVRGADGAVRFRQETGYDQFGPWQSLGGRATSRPAAVEAGSTVVVAVRGADGRMYERVRSAAGWSAGWRAVNFRFTGALALGRRGDGIVVYGRGTDGRLWSATRAGAPGARWSAFAPVPTRPGLQLADPAVDPVGGRLYLRGADGACWTFDPAHPGAGWRSLGGQFTSGFAAFSAPGTTVVLGRGLDQQLYVLTGGQWQVWHLN